MIDRMNEAVIKALLEAMPGEISVIDHNDEVIGWNKHDTRLFHRPMDSMGINFRSCHPKSSLAKVEQIVEEMKSGKRDSARFWIDLPLGPNQEKHKVLIEFFALRDQDKKYLGCLEYTMDVQYIRELEGEKRLLS
jgi:hypothetical protein